MKRIFYSLFFFSMLLILSANACAQDASGSKKSDSQITEKVKPTRTEVITPLHKDSFNNNGQNPERKQGGSPRKVAGYLLFDGSLDGDRQVDPQIAVGGGYVLHGTNKGLIIYTKEGEFVQGVSQNYFNKGIDPKLFFDTHNMVFGFDLWNPWDTEKKKPVNISISETSDPKGAWNTYPVPAPNGVDGGGIGFSKKWIGYSFPGGPEQTFIMKMEQAKSGQPATVYHFAGNLGHPVFTQDNIADLYFFKIDRGDFVIQRITEGEDGSPVCEMVAKVPHKLEFMGYPPQSPQKGTRQRTSSGDRNPKNLVLQSGFIWISQAINYKGKSAVQWHQIKLDGTIVQTGLISGENTNYIQTTLAVNKNNDVLIGFQETNENMFISPRMTYRLAKDAPGTVREIVKLGEGEGATDGVAWGDYSGTVIDGDNLTDLWTIQSLASIKGKGFTVIVKVPFKKKR